ncbi:hypothetical protein ACHAWF_017524 [Thalassiosira exigua]
MDLPDISPNGCVTDLTETMGVTMDQPNDGERFDTNSTAAATTEDLGSITRAGGQPPQGVSGDKKADAWGITNNIPESIPQSRDENTNKSKKRSNVSFLSENPTEGSNPNGISGGVSNKPKFAEIMAEQELEKNASKPENLSGTRVSFCKEVETEEERMMRLAIEASLRDQQEATEGLQSFAPKMPPSAMKNEITGKTVPQNVSFSTNVTYDECDDMDDDMRMAIALSLQEAGEPDKNSFATNDAMDEEGDRKPSALPTTEGVLGPMEDDMKPKAVEMENVPALGDRGESSDLEPWHVTESASATFECKHSVPAAASAAAASASASASTADAGATAASLATAKHWQPGDDSEKLAQAFHQAELATQSAHDAAEAASLKLALKLQEEEDARTGACNGGGGSSGRIGVRTVGRDEFASLKSNSGGGMLDRRKQEEVGMGNNLLKNCHDQEVMSDFSAMKHDDDVDDYFYYASDRQKGVADQDFDLEDEEGDGGIRMNSQSSSSSWKRLDKDTFIGPNGEVRTKHDPELKHRSNAINLLGSHGAKLKDAYNHSGLPSENKKSASVSDRAYNAFRRAESRQSGFKKGVAKQGHGRAENMNAGKTRGGAMDSNARLQISTAINSGLIDTCNGVVKEGKEALVYHASGGWKGRQATDEDELDISLDKTTEMTGSEGYDVAIKVFKRIAEFKGRGSYVDGDPRYHKQKFKTNDQREQVVLWCEKEYRNLIRAYRAGVAVPKPYLQKENILFMRFLGDNGWPSPQLKEIDIKLGSEKWTTFYCQTIVAIRRLYHCARLVHGDLSEYNLLVCPIWQASHGRLVASDERKADDETLQIVLIDFGQAVEVGHPSAGDWLRRDLSTVRDFFVRKGIKALSNEDAEEFVTEPHEEAGELGNTIETIDSDSDGSDGKGQPDTITKETALNAKEESKECGWRHNKSGWDDANDTKVLMEKLKES